MKNRATWLNGTYANQPEKHVTDSQTHFALREVRTHFSNRLTWVVILAASLVLTLIAPFESDRLMRPAPRFGYWVVMVGCTYLAGCVGAALLNPLRPRMSRPMHSAAVAVVNGILVTMVVALLNLAMLGYWPYLADWPELFGTVFVIAAIVTGTLDLISSHRVPSPAPTAAPVQRSEPSAPMILQRLPVDKRGDLVALSVEDHYVRIRTIRGEEIVLLRLSDAMNEVAPQSGLQVHRSHWVASAAITAARREGDRAVLSMTHGPDIPVSRRYVPALKEAGLLPG